MNFLDRMLDAGYSPDVLETIIERRDMFAIAALTGLQCGSPGHKASIAYKVADAMLEERQK
jgi:hypothetical protein